MAWESEALKKINDFLKLKNISQLKCPICGGQSFNCQNNNNPSVMLLMDKDTDSENYIINTNAGIPIYWLNCNSCFYIITFPEKLIEKVLNDAKENLGESLAINNKEDNNSD